MGTPRIFFRTSSIAALTTLIALLGGCRNDVTAPEESHEPAHASFGHYGITTTTHPFVGHIINLVIDISGPNGFECLDVETGVARANQYVNHAPCLPPFFEGDARQKFYVDAAPQAALRLNRGLVMLRSNLNRRLCLDIQGGTASGGEWLQLYPCHGGSNQTFELPPASPAGICWTRGMIFTEVSGFQMVLDAFIPFSTGWMQQYSGHEASNQQFRFRYAAVGCSPYW